MRKRSIAVFLLVTMLVPMVVGVASARAATDPIINEFVFNHTGSDTEAFIEVFGEPSTDYSAFTMLEIEGDSSGAGVIDAVLALGTTDASGFWTDDEDAENGTVTLLLVEGFTGSGGTDLDTDNDGALDTTPWTRIVDDVAVEDGGSSDHTYASTVLSPGYDGTSFSVGGASRIPNGMDTDTAGDWVRNDFDGAGFPGFTGTPELGEALNTPGATNELVQEVPPVPEVNISEIRIDQPSTDNDEYFELVGAAGTALDGLTYLVIGDGTGGSGVVENVTDLTAQAIPSSGYFVAAESSFTLGTADMTTNLNFENSDNVTHLLVSGFTGSNGQDLDTDDDGVLDVLPWAELVDLIALVEEENPPSQTEYHYGPPSVGPDGSFVPGHVYLCDDGWRIGEFNLGITDSPGAENSCDVLFTGECGDPATLISKVQGDGLTSPLVGEQVVIEGIVVGDFQWGGDDDGDLGGFFVQEEDGDSDGDPLTSEGVFVSDGGFGVDVVTGDRVRVNGFAFESFGLTQIESLSDVLVCDSGNTVTPADVTLPVGSVDDLEAFEGMSVLIKQPLVISEFFNFDRFGEIVLTTERQFQPTAIYDPDSPERAQLAEENMLSRIQLEDGRTSQNPDPAIHPNGMKFTLDNRFRGGDMVQNVIGVISYGFGEYEIHPTAGADYTAVNERPDVPDVAGDVKAASFNVLNYFTTLDMEQDRCGPTGGQECRGADADQPEEFERQQAKIVAAMCAIDADVFGLMELENTNPDNDPDPDNGISNYVLKSLVDALNDADSPCSDKTYAFTDSEATGTDAIQQGIIYKTSAVTPLGRAVLDDPEFTDPNNLGEQKTRPAIAETFMQKETCSVFTVVVNHFKSKGSPCGEGDDDPIQGNCNLTRKLGAEALVDWLAGHPTGSGDPDILILGDLNSYDKEDPIDVLKDGGYTDLLLRYGGEEAYTYVFDGQLGYLDYGMANGDLLPQVTGTAAWRINADEPDILDYDTTFKKPAQDALYEPNAYRSSDHDPVIVGLDLSDPDETPPTLDVTVSPDMLWPPNHKYVTVVPTISVSDNFDPNPTVTLISVTSNEPDNGLGDGDMPNDIVINDDGTIDLRAERSGTGDGRIYTITYMATDACGNTTEATVTVTVPFDQGGKGKGR